jgi:hypothetical protein
MPTFDWPDGTSYVVREVRPVGLQELIAEQEIRHARKRLPGLPKLTVRWFEAADPAVRVPDGITAPTYIRTIWIRGDGPAIRNSVTHECFHAWLRSIGVRASVDEEPAAYRFADNHDDEPVARYLRKATG